MKTVHVYCAGCGKRGDKVKLKAGVTAEDRTVAAAAAQQQLLPPWERPEEEKLCMGCYNRQGAAVRQLIKHLSTLPARKLTRHSKPEEKAAVTAEQELKTALQVILERLAAAPKRTRADAEQAASAEQRLMAVVQHRDGRDDEESTAAAQGDSEPLVPQQPSTAMEEDTDHDVGAAAKLPDLLTQRDELHQQQGKAMLEKGYTADDESGQAARHNKTKLPYRTAAELADIIRVQRDRVAQLERELKEARKQSAAAPPKQTSVLALLMQMNLFPRYAQVLSMLVSAFEQERLTQVEIEFLQGLTE